MKSLAYTEEPCFPSLSLEHAPVAKSLVCIALQKRFQNHLRPENTQIFLAPTTFPRKWRLRNECRNSLLTTCHYPDLGSSAWLKQILLAPRPIRNTSEIWEVTRHQYEILRSFLDVVLWAGKPLVTSQIEGCRPFKATKTATATKTSFKKWSCAASNSLIPSHTARQMLEIFSGVEF